jgi:L-aminopeptidase/D-esterase-like protein
MTTTFKITQMDRDTSDGFVRTVHWTASQTDGDFSASTYSTAGFTKEDGMNLIPYEDLTEAQVIDWVKGSLGEEGVAAVDAALAQNIELQKNPVTATGTPWSAA